MKKKLCLMLALALMLVLSGCACEHEWTQADCLNPSVCTKCDEVQGEALGHNFSAATCAAAETCSRCGETQGEPLPHTYGKWEIIGEEMMHACDVCGTIETVAADREVFLMQQLEGHWDLLSEEGPGYSYPVSKLNQNVQGLTLHVDHENGSWLRNPLGGPDIYPVTLKYVDYKEDNSIGYYTFEVDFTESDSLMYLIYVDASDTVALINGDVIITLAKNEELAHHLTGLWASVQNTFVATLELKEDRTFIADVEGQEFTGTWNLRGMLYYTTSRDENAPAYQKTILDLVYEQDGKAVVRSHDISLGDKGKDLEEYLRYSGYINLNLTKDYYSLTRMDADQLEMLKEANLNGEQKILGKWESVSVSTYDYNTSSSDQHDATDYTITFHEDGTFTAMLDQEWTGVWQFRDASLSVDSISYYYNLMIGGVKDNLYAYIGYDNQLSFSTSDRNGSTTIYFNQMSEEEKAALAQQKEEAGKLILGDWTSTTVYTYQNETSSEVNDTGNTFTFREDGTFTTNLEAVPGGTWTVGDIDTQTYEGGYTHTSYHYNLKTEGTDGDINAYLSKDNSGNDLSFSIYSNGISTTYHCSQLSAEDLEKIANADDMIVGTWTGDEFTQYNEESQKQEVVRKESHTFTVNADGTFTSTLPGMAKGTWNFWKIDQYGVGFSFRYGESGLIYRINDAGILEAFIQENDTTYFIDMTKQ